MDPSFQPIWYQGVKTSSGAYITFQIDLIGDSIAFAFHGKSRFTFIGTEYAFNAIGQAFSGLFSPEGDLVNLQLTDASIGATLDNFRIDNCGNSLIDGKLRGLAHFGNDTLNAGDGNLHYLAKNSRFTPQPVYLPSDTTNCGPLTLFAPQGYHYYRWNGELSDQNWFIADSSGTVRLEVANEDCCWSEAETQVIIYPPVQFSFGPDTTILLTDTLELTTSGEYESYLWSTGDTIPDLIIPATELQIGNNQIWLDISSEHCSGSDTINIVVIDNSAINEIDESGILLNPNPAHTFLQITTNSGLIPRSVNIYNQTGINVLHIKQINNRIDVSGLNPGLYIVELVFNNEVIRLKLVIN